jgi:hypothetical protein
MKNFQNYKVSKILNLNVSKTNAKKKVNFI